MEAPERAESLLIDNKPPPTDEDLFWETGEAAVARVRLSVSNCIQEARGIYDPEPVGKEVGHYTSISALACMFAEQSPYEGIDGAPPYTLFATAGNHMNDIEEFAYGRKRILDALASYQPQGSSEDDAINILRSFAQSSLGEDTYCACFSGRKDDLGQWRAYGDDGKGCCIVHPVEELSTDILLSGWVIYLPDTQERVARALVEQLVKAIAPVAKALNSVATFDLLSLIPSLFMFFKNPAFKDEVEFRLIYSSIKEVKPLPTHFREQRGRIVPYVRLPFQKGVPISGIVNGPRSDRVRSKSAIRHMLVENGRPEIEPMESAIPYLP